MFTETQLTEMNNSKTLEFLEKFSPYILTSAFSMAVAFGMVIGLQRGLNHAAHEVCQGNDYRRLVSFRSAAGEAAVCLPAYYLNGSNSLPD